MYRFLTFAFLVRYLSSSFFESDHKIHIKYRKNKINKKKVKINIHRNA